jgi:hypothetical protein
MMANLFLGNQIFHQNYLILSLGNNFNKFQRSSVFKLFLIINYHIIIRFIYCENIVLKNLQGSDVLKLLIAVDELSIHYLGSKN